MDAMLFQIGFALLFTGLRAVGPDSGSTNKAASIQLMEQEARLLTKLLTPPENVSADALKYIRPSLYGKVDVTVAFSFVEVVEVNEKNGYLTASILLSMTWKDVRLQWNRSDFSEVQKLYLPKSRMWVPDLTFLNVLHDESQQSENPTDESVLVLPDGTAVMVPRKHIRAKCDFNMEHFPLDNQTCRIIVSSWLYSTDELDLQAKKEMSLQSFAAHSDWTVAEGWAETKTLRYANYGEFTEVHLVLSLIRKPWFFFYFYVVPGAIILFLLPCVHLFPPSCSQKTTIAGLLLTCVVILLAMFEETFVNFAADSVPKLLSFYVTLLIMCMVSIMISSVTAIISDTKHRSGRLPRILRKIISQYFARLCCFGPYMESQYELIDVSRSLQRNSDQQDDTVGIIGSEHTPAQMGEQTVQVNGLDTLVAEIQMYRYRLQLEREWHQLAIVCDRLAFIAYSLFAIIIVSYEEH